MRAAIAAVALTFMSTTALAQSYRMGDASAEQGAKGAVPITITGTRTQKSFITVYVGDPADTALPGIDYPPLAKSIEVLPSDTKLSFEIPTLINDAVPGPAKTATVKLVINRNGKLLDGTGKFTIKDSDVAPPPPPATQTCPDGTVILATATCPVPPPPPPSTDPLIGETPIASNFDLKTMLQPSWGTGAIAPSAAPYPKGDPRNDVVGAFRFQCAPGQLLYDDPIVFPGQPGKSHLHQFYGNTGANAYSTYKSLRTSGDSNCGTVPVNRSGYWQPAMLDGKGNVIKPLYTTVYYKRRPSTDPIVSDPTHPYYQGKAIPLPNGLKFIFGFDMIAGTAPPQSFDYICVDAKGIPVTSQTFKTLADLANANICLAGMQVWSRGHTPTCWNGKDLDSADHRSHMAYAPRSVSTGQPKCPSTHPYVVADFQLSSAYAIIAGDDLHLWELSSDMGRVKGSTYHADFFMAWDPDAHSGPIGWEGPNGCIEGLRNCSGGDLGTGKQVIGMWARAEASAPNRVPIPPNPAGPMAGMTH